MINLRKGENVILDVIDYTENNILVGFKWHISDSSEFDIDASAFLLSEDDKIRSNADFIFYNQVTDHNKCISLSVDSDNDNVIRAFNISLSKIPHDIKKIMFVLTIDQAEERHQDFSMVKGVSLSIYDNEKSKEELIRYNVDIENKEVSLMIGSLYLHNNQWKFKTIGQGFNKGLGVIANNYNVHLEQLPQEENQDNTIKNSGLKRKRRTPNQILLENTLCLLKGFENMLPTICDAFEKKLNESNTRMILDKIFIDILGYKMAEIKAEQEIQGRRADYVLAINHKDAIVVEVKKAGMILRKKQVFQATSYGAYSGIQWVLLTNLVEWQVYHVSMQDKVESNLVFSVDLKNNITQEDAEFLILISRYGLSRKNLIEKVWAETNALSETSIISSILTEDVITKIRMAIKRDKGVIVSNDKIQEVLEKILNLN